MKIGDKIQVLPGMTNFPELVGMDGIVEEVVYTQTKNRKGTVDHTRYNVQFTDHRVYGSQMFGFEDHQIKKVGS